MSFSKPNPTNPAGHFFEWRNGQIQFYDREKKETIVVPLPFQFIVLDQLHIITGYSDEDESGFWSNELRSLKEDFNVRTRKGTQYVGRYKNEQGSVLVPRGARYTKSMYIAHPNSAGELLLGNLKLSGAALTSWIDSSKGIDFSAVKARITGFTDGKKGTTEYKIPTFAFVKISDDEHEVAFDLDTQLQTYLDQYLSAPKNEDGSFVHNDDEGPEPDPEATSDADRADFDQRAADAAKDRQNKQAAKDLDVEIEDFDKPIDLSEIPF